MTTISNYSLTTNSVSYRSYAKSRKQKEYRQETINMQMKNTIIPNDVFAPPQMEDFEFDAHEYQRRVGVWEAACQQFVDKIIDKEDLMILKKTIFSKYCNPSIVDDEDFW
mmetsp:Transcript_5772/g.8070  ORF Transcript_5772/g.8070 Transcript_5772/m.8070 type:complete len:110 (-) Transcript_5772:26-355(-)